jgi:putative ABC transport system permease protein
MLHVSNQKLGDHADQLAMQKQEAAILRAVPGVVSVARTSSSPLSYSGSNASLSTDRKQTIASAHGAYYLAPDSLIQTWGLKLIQGRDFNPGEILELDQNTTTEFTKVVVISKDLAAKLYPGLVNVVGKELYFGMGEDANAVRIVGVIERLQTSGAQAGQEGEFSLLIPVRLTNDPYSGYTIRTEPGQRDRVMKDAAEALRKASPTPLNVRTRSTEAHRIDRYRSEKGLAWMLLTVSVLLILITASGIVGMSTLWVAQRAKQIGVRRALGARRIDILIYFITENMLITTGGIAAGTLLALALNQLLVSQFELSKLPMAYLFIAPGVFWLLGIAAVYAPAWRAASISPATATRGA